MRASRNLPALALTAIGTTVLAAAGAGARTASAAGPTAAPKLVAVTDGRPGVVLADHGNSVVVKQRLRRASRRGRSLSVVCTEAPKPGGGVVLSSSSDSALSPSTTRLAVPPNGDWCVVTITIRRTHGRTTKPIAALYRNPEGLDALYEHVTAGVMGVAAGVALGDVSDKPLDAARVAQILRGQRVLGRPLAPVALAAPDTEVASGQLGIWTMGQRVSVTARTPGGRALYLDFDAANRSISTNVYDGLNDETLSTTSSGR
jgi:hypothetical protein